MLDWRIARQENREEMEVSLLKRIFEENEQELKRLRRVTEEKEQELTRFKDTPIATFVDPSPLVKSLVGPNLTHPPSFSELNERLNRHIPAAYPVDPNFIRAWREQYRQEEKKEQSAASDEFFFLKASESERVSTEIFGPEAIQKDFRRLVKDKTEEAVRSGITPLVQECLDWLVTWMDVPWVEHARFSRNQAEERHSRTSVQRTRPDWMFHIRGILVFRGEEKGDTSNESLETAKGELVTKMDAWNPIIFGHLEYVFGYAIQGTMFQLYALFPDKSVQYPERGACGVRSVEIGRLLNLSRIKHRMLLFQYIINIAQIFNAMEPMLPRDGPKLEQIDPYWKRNKSGDYSRLIFFPRFVRKILIDNDGIQYDDRLIESLYAKVKDGTIVNTIKCEQRYPKRNAEGIVLHLYPLGRQERQPVTNDELQTFTKDILLALKSLHKAGFCHRDVRWPNMVQKTDNHWILIDLDFCAILNKKGHAEWPFWTNGVPTPNGNEKWTRQHDLQQLALMIRQLTTLSEAESLASKIEQSKTADAAIDQCCKNA